MTTKSDVADKPECCVAKARHDSKIEVVILPKCDKTLRNNINTKNETSRKRTSLTIVPHHGHNNNEVPAHIDHLQKTCVNVLKFGERNLTNSTADNQESLMGNSTQVVPDRGYRNNMLSFNGEECESSLSNHKSSICDEDNNLQVLPSEHVSKKLNANDNCDLGSINANRREVFDAFKPDENCAEPTICILKKDKLVENCNKNEQLELRSTSFLTCNNLISPQEAPIGRRYAEVAQFMSYKRSSDPGIAPYKPCSQIKNQSRFTGNIDNETLGNNLQFDSKNNFSSANRQLQFAISDSFKGQACERIDNDISEVSLNTLRRNEGKCFNENPCHTENKDTSLKYKDERECYFVSNIASEESNVLYARGCEGDVDGIYDDDMQALLPKSSHHISRDEFSESHTSLVSSSDGGILAAGETSSEASRSSANRQPCDLGLIERLLLTHPVWFLQDIQRSGAVHFLQGKEDGNFIVRGSSQPNTMAVSVRLPPDAGPYIEHYLVQSQDGVLSLESSRFKFDSIPALIAHYAQCCDELPVQLILPQALREAKNRQQLSSLALLGQEFWRYPMSWPKLIEKTEIEHQNLDAKSPSSFTETSGLGATVFSDSACSNNAQQLSKHFNASSINGNELFSQADTPSDTTSSMSSFTNSGGQHIQLMSPESVDSIILTMSPVIEVNAQRGGVVMGMTVANDLSAVGGNGCSSLSTFKSNAPVINTLKPSRMNELGLTDHGSKRPQRPKPPNTLNLDLRKPPAPPMRWSKPLSPSQSVRSPCDQAGVNGSGNFTVTTTVTFTMDQSSPQFIEVSTPGSTNANLNSGSNATLQSFSKRLSPEGECRDRNPVLASQGSFNWLDDVNRESTVDQQNTSSSCFQSGDADNSNKICGSALEVHTKPRRLKLHKLSKHYQESDILESPEIYCRSTLGDKISDYEDLWTQDSSERASLLTSFKPQEYIKPKRPDILAETPTTAALNLNILSSASNSSENDAFISASTKRMEHHSASTNTLPEQDAPFDSQTCETEPHIPGDVPITVIVSQPCKTVQSEDGGPNKQITQCNEPRSKQGSPFYAEPADTLHQSKLLVNSAILRRSQRSPLLQSSYRHSEPMKSGIVSPLLDLSSVIADNDKTAGSLDNLKEQESHHQTQNNHHHIEQHENKRPRGRFEHWQLDNSWQFVNRPCTEESNQNDIRLPGDYENKEICRGRGIDHETESTFGYIQDISTNDSPKCKPITVHQIIAKRFPDLNLPELVRSCTPKHSSAMTNNLGSRGHNPIFINAKLPQKKRHDSSNDSTRASFDSATNPLCRLSSYDNVERSNINCCYSSFHDHATYFIGIDSEQSDDGTVFSEPWDSSQWDSFVPQDDATQTSDTIHFSKCPPIVSEDDTIVEDLSSNDVQSSLKSRKSNDMQKVATILRNRSLRDRTVLCHPRNKLSPFGAGVGDDLRVYTLQLAEDHCSTFSRNIENFISCTKESREAAPQVVMRNMRQFMNGMKNYLVKHGEGKFHQEVEAARARLKPDEFLNLDAILEAVMHQLIILPLREHLYGMFVDYYTRSEDIQRLAENVKYACSRGGSEFGIRSSVTPPTTNDLQAISNLLLRLQEAELPLDKLDIFLTVIATIFSATGCPRGQQLGADDFLPILIYVVAKCGFVGAEIEAEFMWGLLQQPLLNGEPGYYLTALCSAVHELKRFKASATEDGTTSLDWRSSSLPACSSVLRVIIPDECNGSLQTRTLPIRPLTTTREVCRIIAHKARITNPQDYALFKLVNGEETLLNDCECPQDVRFSGKGKHIMLAYKRIDAKIAWPTASVTD